MSFEIIWDGRAPFIDIVQGIKLGLGENVRVTTSMPTVWRNDVYYIVIPPVNHLSVFDKTKHFIFYQIEQPDSHWMTDEYYDAMDKCEIVWNFFPLDDKTPRRILDHPRCYYVPFGYHEGMANQLPLNCTEQYDVLFLGTNSERRLELFSQLRSAGLTVYTGHGFTREEHIDLIGRSKVYLNCHCYSKNSALETARLALPLSYGKLVVSEPSFYEKDNYNYESLVVITDDIVGKCIEYTQNRNLRESFEAGLQERFRELTDTKGFFRETVEYVQQQIAATKQRKLDFLRKISIKPAERILFITAAFGDTPRDWTSDGVQSATTLGDCIKPVNSKFLCYSDSIKSHSTWEYCTFSDEELTEIKEICYLKANTRPNIIKSRFVKSQCYRLSAVQSFQPTLIVWLDANIQITTADFSMYAQGDITLYPHPFLKSAHADIAYSQGNEKMCIRRYSYEPLQEQIDFYTGKGYTQEISSRSNYPCSGIMIYSPNDKMKLLMNKLWKEIITWSIHDQVSLAYIMWKLDIKHSLITDGTITGSSKHTFINKLI